MVERGRGRGERAGKCERVQHNYVCLFLLCVNEEYTYLLLHFSAKLQKVLIDC